MSRFDLLVRGGTVVTPDGIYDDVDVAVSEGRFAEIGTELSGEATEEIDARGLVVLPGVVDIHVHLNDPGRAHWEGFASGTSALAAGGTTTLVDMPLNASPPTLDGASFDLKVDAARGRAAVDFALWGGLVGQPLDALDELADRGVVGFKAFMCSSGIDDFPAADDEMLHAGMSRAAALGLPVAVHAESAELTARLAAEAVANGQVAMRDYLRSRPVVAELDAIERAIAISEITGCSLHVAHVSTGRGVSIVAAARARGVDVTCETCPHYLALTEEDAEILGAIAKCAPPLRPPDARDELWAALLAGDVDLIASDHSPSPPDLKTGEDMFAVWGGIAGGETLLRIMLSEGATRGLAFETIARLACTHPARRLALARKGRMERDADADLVLLDARSETELRQADLHSRHRLDPFVGRALRGRVVRTIVRGSTVWRDGAILGAPAGRLVRPEGFAP